MFGTEYCIPLHQVKRLQRTKKQKKAHKNNNPRVEYEKEKGRLMQNTCHGRKRNDLIARKNDDEQTIKPLIV
ncbi:hypothetical protein DW036_13490 [Bacteroides sp. AF39-11AC]|nr:hypothetical protein DW036_13490 [Bacteroides sp. AF39-11AC]